MEKIKLNLLGTGQAIPTASRNHTAILLSYKYENILIDCGEGTQRQFRKAKINPGKITRLLISHWHGDHVLGIPGLFQTLALSKYNKKLYVYGPKGTKKYINEILKIFESLDKIKVEVKEVNGKFFENDDIILEARRLDHGAPTNGYSFREKDRRRIKKAKLERVLKKLKLNKSDLSKISKLRKGKDIKIKGKLIKYKDYTFVEKGRKVSFILDTRICDNAVKLAKDSDLLVIESTYSKSEEDLARKYKHLTSEQAAQIARKAKVKQLVLTHISQRYEHKEDRLLREAKKVFSKVKIAKDLMEVSV